MTRHIRYLGFVVHTDCREYTMAVRALDPQAAWSEVAMQIAHDTFLSGRLSYQDAPSACARILEGKAAAVDAWEPPESLRVEEEHLRIYDESLPPRKVPFRKRAVAENRDETRGDPAE